jgi:hypothetical protein
MSPSHFQAMDELADERKVAMGALNREQKHDMVNSPPHYKDRVPGLECIDVTQHFNFCLGNAIKYIWRADMKGGDQDLEKAIWYLQRELSERQKRD